MEHGSVTFRLFLGNDYTPTDQLTDQSTDRQTGSYGSYTSNNEDDRESFEGEYNGDVAVRQVWAGTK